MQKVIYTVGSSNREAQEFIDLLRGYQIKNLADVRRFPTSKFEHFKKENISKILIGAGINYFYLGNELGGYRSGGYESYVTTQAFLEGLQRLMEIASADTTAVMCSERFPWRCHRRFIGSRLRERGWQVIHIIEKDRVWVPTP